MGRIQLLRIGALCLAAATACLALMVVLLVALNELSAESAVSSLVEVPPALAFASVGTLIILRRPTHAIGWLMLLIGLPLVFEQAGLLYGTYTFVTHPNRLPGGGLLLWLAFGVWGLGYGGIALLVLLFPTGRPLSPHWRWVGLAAIGGAFGWSGLVYVALWPYRGPRLLSDSVPPGLETIQVAASALLGVVTIAFLAAVVSAILRLRRSTGIERQQLKWFVYAVTLTIGMMLLFAALSWFNDGPTSGRIDIATNLLYSVLFSAIPAAIGIAILRFRLWDIDLIINRTLVYGTLTAGVVGVYMVVVGGLGTLFQARGNLWIGIVATGLVAVLFAPVHNWLQSRINRLLYGERDDPYAVLAHLGRRLEATLAPDAVLPTIVQTVAEALKLPYVAITLNQAGEEPTAAATSTPVQSPRSIPLSYHGEQLGHLLLGPRTTGATFTPAEERLLDDLARQAGVALAAVRLTADLQQSRRRLVEARAEERRRLRRDLHDGLGPQLATQVLKLEAARELVRTNPERAEKLIDSLIEKSQGIVTEVRRLVYDLRPPALDELGLSGAIREFAAQGGSFGLHIVLDAPDALPPLPAAVEVATYRIIQEAVTNATRHGKAQTCRIQLEVVHEADDALLLEICDDGSGLPTDYRAGVGLTSMRERAQELGGTCSVESSTGRGVRVVAHLPLGKE